MCSVCGNAAGVAIAAIRIDVLNEPLANVKPVGVIHPGFADYDENAGPPRRSARPVHPQSSGRGETLSPPVEVDAQKKLPSVKKATLPARTACR